MLPVFCNDSAPHLDFGALHPVVASRKIDFQSEVLAHAGLILLDETLPGSGSLHIFTNWRKPWGRNWNCMRFNNLTKALSF